MRYRYKPTGAVIEIASVLTSPAWEEVRADAPEDPKKTIKKTAKKAVKPDDSVRND